MNGTTEYRLIYAGQLSPIAKVDASGTVLETYVYGLGVNSPDYIIKDGTEYRVVKDHLGSMRMIVDSITGTIEKSITYDEFGNITNETGTLDTIFGYAGGIRDTDTGLTKFGARWYNPVTGRWIEKEPLGFGGSDNFYSYCDDDPINYVDVSGLEKKKKKEYTCDETQDIIISLIEDIGDDNIIYDLLDTFNNLTDKDKYDYKMKEPGNTFCVNGETLTADQFGNYLAGYATRYMFGFWGEMLNRLGGHIYASLDYLFGAGDRRAGISDNWFDDEGSVEMINKGVEDAKK